MNKGYEEVEACRFCGSFVSPDWENEIGRYRCEKCGKVGIIYEGKVASGSRKTGTAD